MSAIRVRSFASLAFVALLFPSLLAPDAHAQSGTPAARGGAIWGRSYFPNAILTTHEGKPVRFFDDLVEGKVVVINFIYTSCPDACPLETARLAEVQGILGDRVGQDIFFYSITIDPERDTPAVLAEYRERYQAADGWTFLTGSEKDITLLRKKLGLYRNASEEKLSNHNLSLIVGNQATGRWQKASPFENPYILASQIGNDISGHTAARELKNRYEDAPKLRSIGSGESLFRTRCQVCHAIGSSSEDAQRPRVGPNLFGVLERRERAWLERWIREPDVMLAEEDSIAVGLFHAFNRVPMPNLRLSDEEIAHLLDYIGTESARVAKHEALANVLPKRAEGADSCCQKSDHVVLGATTPETPETPDDGGENLPAEQLPADADRSAEPDLGSSSPSLSLWAGFGVLLGAAVLLLRRSVS